MNSKIFSGRPDVAKQAKNGTVYHFYDGTAYRVDLLTVLGSNRREKRKNLKLILKFIDMKQIPGSNRSEKKRYIKDMTNKYGVAWLLKKQETAEIAALTDSPVIIKNRNQGVSVNSQDEL